MTVEFKLTVPATVFPDGTTVKAYPATALPERGRSPIGASVAEGEVSGGAVTFTGLTDGVQYVAVGTVSEKQREAFFTAGDPQTRGLAQTGENEDITGNWQFSGKVGFFGTTPQSQPAALTAATAETIDATYGEQEKKTIENLRTRINELETKLKALGLLA